MLASSEELSEGLHSNSNISLEIKYYLIPIEYLVSERTAECWFSRQINDI